MFDVVVHVEVEKTKNWIELDRARVQTVIADVFRQPRMLRQRENLMQPSSVEPRQWEEKHRKPTVDPYGPRNHSRIKQKINSRPPEHLAPFTLRNEVSCLLAGHTQSVNEHDPEHLNCVRNPEKIEQYAPEISRTHDLNFRIKTDHDGLGVMSRMTPTRVCPLFHVHKGTEEVKGLVQPARSERSPVSTFVPARVTGTVNRAVEKKRGQHPMGTDRSVPRIATQGETRRPQAEVNKRVRVIARRKRFEFLSRDLGTIPIVLHDSDSPSALPLRLAEVDRDRLAEGLRF